MALSLWALIIGSAAAAKYAPFKITSLTTHQPNGNPAGQVNYYNIGFNVTSTNGGGDSEEAYCFNLWGDNNNNCGSSCVAYSTAVPTGTWIPCARNAENLGDTSSNFAFQLYPKFSIGDFTLAIQQILHSPSSASTIITTQSSPYSITNASTNDLVCTINPQEVYLQQHAQGDCQTPADFAGFSLPITSATSCDTAAPVHLSFPVQERTLWGETVFVTGNISALGSWDPARAVALDASQYNDFNTLWSGGGNGDVVVPVGTSFEYIYFQRNLDGSLLWECGENRTWTTGFQPLEPCGSQVVGNDPDYFRCGNH